MAITDLMVAITDSDSPQSDPNRFHIYSHTPNKSSHIYVNRVQDSCNLWLTPFAPSSSPDFKARELREIARLVNVNRTILLNAWEEFHG